VGLSAVDLLSGESGDSVDLSKPLESMSASELREALASGILSESARARAQVLLRAAEADADRVHRAEVDAKERRHQKAQERQQRQREKFRGTDERTVKNSSKNGLSAGGLASGAFGVDQALEIYDKLESRGLLPKDALTMVVEILRRLHFTEAQIVYIISAAVVVFLVTMGWKVAKHYER
tara:strand:- start:716 stop:1255 length:540 start_codon:yes stop_codon:yes gene_type:complete